MTWTLAIALAWTLMVGPAAFALGRWTRRLDERGLQNRPRRRLSPSRTTRSDLGPEAEPPPHEGPPRPAAPTEPAAF